MNDEIRASVSLIITQMRIAEGGREEHKSRITSGSGARSSDGRPLGIGGRDGLLQPKGLIAFWRKSGDGGRMEDYPVHRFESCPIPNPGVAGLNVPVPWRAQDVPMRRTWADQGSRPWRRKAMKKIIEQVEDEGLEKFLGERITLFCANYIYTGELKGVNDTCVLLGDPSIVYETGSFSESGWKDAQKLPCNEWYVQISAIESFGKMK